MSTEQKTFHFLGRWGLCLSNDRIHKAFKIQSNILIFKILNKKCKLIFPQRQLGGLHLHSYVQQKTAHDFRKNDQATSQRPQVSQGALVWLVGSLAGPLFNPKASLETTGVSNAIRGWIPLHPLPKVPKL